jgi:hypothetical protein
VAVASATLTPDVIGASLYGRRCVVLIGEPPPVGQRRSPAAAWQAILTVNQVANDLRVKFRVAKPWAQPLAISEVSIFNLSPDHRKMIDGKSRFPVRILAGYGATLRVVAELNGMQCASEFQPGTGDVVTKIEGFHGNGQLGKAQMQLGIGTSYSDAIQQLAAQIGRLGPAAERVIAKAAKGRVFPDGYSSNDTVAAQLKSMTDDIGVQWNVTDGEIRVTEGDGTTQELFVLSPDSGLIGSPLPDSPPSPGKLRFIRAKALLNPTFVPGALCEVRSAAQSGFWKCFDVSHEGDTWANEWYSNLQLHSVSSVVRA